MLIEDAEIVTFVGSSIGGVEGSSVGSVLFS